MEDKILFTLDDINEWLDTIDDSPEWWDGVQCSDKEMARSYVIEGRSYNNIESLVSFLRNKSQRLLLGELIDTR